jgi:hypothetical protein
MAPASSSALDWSSTVCNQSFDDVLRSRVVETEEDDAYHLPGRPREDLAEIEVERQHDPLRCSANPFWKMSPFGSRCKPSSRR